ncbi:serine/threonine-protein kinase PLK2-like [Physella acuta]|uniref:serine/threonine-protein kinase PLK2-like n=1 Tax=Physella acuta TaxID=109671 RepID=UPI0027DC8C73|nr:serine/threonine-protein kinase PLK2-like [Physella acuta]
MDYIIHKTIGTGRFVAAYQLGVPRNGLYTLKITDKTTTDVSERDIRDGVEAAIDKLRHIHIQHCFAYHIDEHRRLLLLLEPVKHSLLDAIRQKPFHHFYLLRQAHRDQSLLWFAQMADGVQYLHAQNICHRDLRTDHVFLDENDDVKLGDLGLLNKQETRAKSFNFFGGVFNEPCYMGPEMFNNEKYTSKTDIWSLGCVFYEVFYGKPAFVYSEAKQIFVKKKMPAFRYRDVYVLIGQMLEIDREQRIDAKSVVKHVNSLRGAEYEKPDFMPFSEVSIEWEKVTKAVKKHNNPRPARGADERGGCSIS